MITVTHYAQDVDSWGWTVLGIVWDDEHGWGLLDVVVATHVGAQSCENFAGGDWSPEGRPGQRTPADVAKSCWDLIEWYSTEESALDALKEAQSRRW